MMIFKSPELNRRRGGNESLILFRDKTRDPISYERRIRLLASSVTRSMAAFTMVEIALCIAIIGFALVAIIGVLPTAMRVQQDNRSDTLIDQDGNYFMEAIRHGAQGLDDLTNYVYQIALDKYSPSTKTYQTNVVYLSPTNYFIPPRRIIGALSVPYGYAPDPADGYFVFQVEAKVRSISGAAVEKDPQSAVTFDYLLTSEVSAFHAYDAGSAFGAASTNDIPQIDKNLQRDLSEIRLTFRWPLSSVTGKTGNNKKVFRALVSGNLVDSTNDFFFFQPTTFVAAP